jgi:2-polyprenyl-3-methyl-5-hydroxy-6-metoxy-1,4-benzoquinol methylase
LVKIDIIEENDVIDSVLIKMPKTYPAYFGTYDRFGVIRDYVDRFDNLFLIGRNGMHRYNNQDHSMLTAMTAVENIVAGIKTKSNIWDVNTEKEYHESKVTAVEQLTEAYSAVNKTEDFQYDPDIYWEDTAISYPYYPTVRHRRRFVLNSISKYVANPAGCTVFDYGCGEGEVLKEIKDHFGLDDSQLAGCDISGTAIQMAKKKIDSGNLFPEVFPKINRKPDIVVCCEVIEHTADYYQILRWIFENIAHGGKLILTTQSGKIHASDRYTGHTQHFDIKYLKSLLEDIGFNIEYSSLWGFPLFTVQKYLTNLRFDRIRENYLEGQLTLRKKVVFSLAYLAYYMHDVIKFGPQIYIVAVKSKHPVK